MLYKVVPTFIFTKSQTKINLGFFSNFRVLGNEPVNVWFSLTRKTVTNRTSHSILFPRGLKSDIVANPVGTETMVGAIYLCTYRRSIKNTR